MLSQTLSLPSPAKLNLFLYITGRRENGYHELQTLFQFLEHGDEMQFSANSSGLVTVSPELEGVPLESNLIWKAAQALKERTDCRLGADIHIDKILPMGGGIGGGSSNAATTLVALNHLWELNLSAEELAEIGLNLAPMCCVCARLCGFRRRCWRTTCQSRAPREVVFGGSSGCEHSHGRYFYPPRSHSEYAKT